MIGAVLVLLASSSSLDDYARANALFEHQKFSEAAEALDRAIKENPDYVPAWTLRGKLAMVFNRFDMARAAFLRAASLQPGSAYAQFMLGFFYYFDNDFIRAVP
ncbi:MAG: tetratricopeptide repeat protein, partial [Bryobacteraceae bacterium]